jgi:hypothetical protein
VDILESELDVQKDALATARAGVAVVDARTHVLLPAQHATAGAAFRQAEIACVPKPIAVTPIVITSGHDVIAERQLRPSGALLDIQMQGSPGIIVARLEPIYPGQTNDIPRPMLIPTIMTACATLICPGPAGSLCMWWVSCARFMRRVCASGRR